MAGDLRNGALIQSRAWGYTDGTAEIADAFVYGGLGGAVSSKTTTVTLAGASTPGFSQSFAGAFTWTPLGLPASVTYPTCPSCTNAPGRTVYYGYTNGRLTSVGPYYVQAVTYHPNSLFNEVTHTRRGVEAVSGVKDLQTIAATSMPRPASLGTDGVTLSGTGADGDWSTGDFGYDGVGNITAMGTDTFTYDRVSRLTSATLAGIGAHSYTCDPFANLTTYNGASRATSTSTNRLTSAGYDAAGNLLSHTGGAYTYTFDALNQLVRAVSLGVHRLADFDGGGERVLVRQPFAAPAVSVTVRGLDGKVLRDVSFDGTTWRWVKDWVYREGVAVASVGEGEGIRHGHRDHLGSLRVVTNRCGEKVLGTRSWPYGEEIGVGAGTPQATSERLRFTGHERDFGLGDRTGDDLDYLHARSYAPTLARFLSVDPGRDVDPTVPQSLNTYTYARGNPLKYFDPDGKAVVPAAALGAMIGGVMGLAGSVLAQAYVADWDFSSINWRDARAAAAGGAISGSLFGATMGLSALAGAGVGTAAVVGAGTNLVGNAASRELDSDPATSALSSRDIAWDALSGAAGGALGSRIQQGIRAALPQVELQIASSTPAARFGNYGASQAVKGHIAKAHSLNLQAEISGSIVGAKTTNVVTPVVRVHLVERENREFSLFSSATPQ